MDPILQALMAADPTLGGALPAAGSEFAFDPLAGQAPQDPYAQAPAQAPSPAPAPVSGSTSRSVSGSALDRGTLDYLQAGKPASRFDKKLAGIAAEEEARAAGIRGELDAIGTRQKQAVESQRQVDFGADVDDPSTPQDETVGRMDQMAANAQKSARQQMTMAQDIQAINDAAWQRVNRAGADYQGQLATLRAARIDPKGYYNEMGEGERQENNVRQFLALQMIGTGKPGFQEMGQAVLNQMDKDVQRNIDAQVENLRKDKDVAEGFRAAWALASQNAVSEEQAKTRVAGMILQAHKDFMAAEVATKYDSDLARAAAEQATVAIDQKILENDLKQRDLARKYELDRAQLATSKYATDSAASNVRAQIAESKAAREAAGQKGPFDPELLVVDPETGERRYLANDKESKKKVEDIALSAENFQDVMQELDGAIRATNGRALGGAKDLKGLRNSADAKVAALANRALYAMAKIMDPTARAVTDKDFDNANASVPIAGIFTRSTGEEARQAVRGLIVNETRNAYRILTTDISPGAVAASGQNPYGARVPVQEGAGAEASSTPPVTTKLDKAAAVFDTPEARKTSVKSYEEADAQWLRYAASNPQGKKFLGSEDHPLLPGHRIGADQLVTEPGWADDMGLLAVTMSDSSLPQAQRVQARTKLQEIMKDPDNLDAAYYAKYLLGK